MLNANEAVRDLEREATEWATAQLREFMHVYTVQEDDGRYVARLSAPGYLDCTDWTSPHEREIDAVIELFELYGD